MNDLVKITEFNIKINKENVLKGLNCFPESPVYGHISEEFNRLLPAAECLLRPVAAARFKGNRVYCLIGAGGEISDFSKRLFDSGEAVDGLIINAIADEFIFEADKLLGGSVKTECAKRGMGVLKRLEAPAYMPLEKQREILEAVGEPSVTLTDGYMLKPVKSLGYILELTSDGAVFNAQHDCSKCKSVNCPRRSAPFKGGFDTLSKYDYKPKKTMDEAVICVDIGTTTLAFELIKNGRGEASYTELNAQRRFGADVLSRIEAANRGRGAELKQIICSQLLNGIKKLSESAEKIDKIIIAANTTMVYLLIGYSCKELGEYPFKAIHTATAETTFKELVKNSVTDAETVILGGLSAFVGGDITSGMYMCDFDLSDKLNLFIDLGTNGEMAAGNRDRIIVTSTAAGPAFEGGRITCGTGSVDGAVCGVNLKSGELKTINDKPPLGICGTGVIEIVSELLDAGIIDKTGLLAVEYFEKGYPLTDNIRFTQSDVREIQTAKSAIRSGIDTLLRRLDVTETDIDTLYLAGGFGYGLDIKKACNIGLIPPGLADKVKILGNSALGGAVKYAAENGKERIEHMKKISSEISLGNDDAFNETYIKNMNF